MELNDRFYTSTEVAEILGVSLRSVYRYLEEGKLTADVKTATGRHRFTKQNILDFLYPMGENTASSDVSVIETSSDVPTNLSTGSVDVPNVSSSTDDTIPANVVGNQPVQQQPQEAPVAPAVEIETPDNMTQASTASETPATASVPASAQSDVVVGSESADVAIPVNSNSDVDSANLSQQDALVDQSTQQMADTEQEEEPVDWLAKFRAAAEKHKAEMDAKRQESSNVSEEQEAATSQSSVSQSTPVSAPQPQTSAPQQTVPVAAAAAVVPPVANATQAAVNTTTVPTPQPAPVTTPVVETPVQSAPQVESEKSAYYYRSSTNDLKELAQYVNKTATKANVPYAFTMNAGLSLHKLIRPFSILHIYVRRQDREFFEKALELTPCAQSEAQLCIFIGSQKIFDESTQLHNLSVVSNAQIKKDLLENGEVDLVSELEDLDN